MDEIVQFDFPTDSPKIIKVIGVIVFKCLLNIFMQQIVVSHVSVARRFVR